MVSVSLPNISSGDTRKMIRFHPSPRPNDALWFAEDGLHIGAYGPLHILGLGSANEADETCRLEIMLAIAFHKRLAPSQINAIVAADTIFRAGDQALAHIRLAVSGLVRLAEPDDLPNRLSIAETLLAKGMTPADILKELGCGQTSDQLKRYDTDQPRIPAGNSNERGRWTGGITSQTAATAASDRSRSASTVDESEDGNAPSTSLINPVVTCGENIAANC